MILRFRLAWLLTKTASPVVGATKLQHSEEMVGAAEPLFRRDWSAGGSRRCRHKWAYGERIRWRSCGLSVWSAGAIRKYNGGSDAARRYYDDPGRDEIAKKEMALKVETFLAEELGMGRRMFLCLIGDNLRRGNGSA